MACVRRNPKVKPREFFDIRLISLITIICTKHRLEFYIDISQNNFCNNLKLINESQNLDTSLKYLLNEYSNDDRNYRINPSTWWIKGFTREKYPGLGRKTPDCMDY